MLRNEDLVLVFRREHLPRVKAHAERGDVGTKIDNRRREFTARALAAVLRIGDRPAMAIRVAKIHSRLRRMVELIRRLIIPEQIPTIVREPQVMALGIPIEAHRVPDTARHDFVSTAIRIHA